MSRNDEFRAIQIDQFRVIPEWTPRAGSVADDCQAIHAVIEMLLALGKRRAAVSPAPVPVI
jgi:hypothetical protein